MTEKIIKFKTAKLAKEKGFTAKIGGLYIIGGNLNGKIGMASDAEDYVQAPTQSLLQKWLREAHNLHISITRVMVMTNGEGYLLEIRDWRSEETPEPLVDYFKTHEEALEKGVYKSLKLIK